MRMRDKTKDKIDVYSEFISLYTSICPYLKTKIKIYFIKFYIIGGKKSNVQYMRH